MELEFSPEVRVLRKEIRRFVDEEFRPVLDDLEETIDHYHDLNPEHPELTDNIRPIRTIFPKKTANGFGRKHAKPTSGRWAFRRSTVAEG